jgi:hypothetical protein
METVLGLAIGIISCALLLVVTGAAWEDGRRVGRDEGRRGCGKTS